MYYKQDNLIKDIKIIEKLKNSI